MNDNDYDPQIYGVSIDPDHLEDGCPHCGSQQLWICDTRNVLICYGCGKVFIQAANRLHEIQPDFDPFNDPLDAGSPASYGLSLDDIDHIDQWIAEEADRPFIDDDWDAKGDLST